MDSGQYGLNVSSTDYVDDGVRLLRTTDLGAEGVADGGVFLEGPMEDRFLVRSGDILFTRSGATVGQAYLACASDEGSSFAGYLVRFRPRASVDSRFIYYTTQAQPFKDQVASEAVVSTIPNFNADRYANIRIPLPDHSSQRRVADFLDDQVARIDNIIAARRRQVELIIEECDQAIDEVIWSDQQSLPVKFLVQGVTSGPRGWGDFVSDEGRPFLRIGNLPSRGINLMLDDLVRVLVEDSAETRRATVQQGDVLVGITASLGDVGFVGADMPGATFSQHVARLRPIPERAVPAWLAWSLQTRRVRKDIRTGGYGGTKVGLGLSEVANLSVPETIFEEQIARAKIADARWTEYDTLRSCLLRSTESLHELKRSLITAAVTGEFDVSSADGSRVQV
jgi:type I restriction enzyme S subunit